MVAIVIVVVAVGATTVAIAVATAVITLVEKYCSNPMEHVAFCTRWKYACGKPILHIMKVCEDGRDDSKPTRRIPSPIRLRRGDPRPNGGQLKKNVPFGLRE